MLASCAGIELGTHEGPPVPAPTYSVGDRWVYNAKDGFRLPVTWQETREVVAIDGNGITVRVTQKGPTVDSVRNEVWTAPQLVRVGAVFDDETRRFATPLVGYEFPLTPGKTWNQWVHNFNESTKKEGDINRYGRVSGWTTVTTPAGTFDAIMVRVFMHLDDEEFWRTATDCSYLIAYSPVVRGMVREEKEAEYKEKGSVDRFSTIRSQHALLELASFTPGQK